MRKTEKDTSTEITSMEFSDNFQTERDMKQNQRGFL